MVAWTRRHLSDEQVEWLRELKFSRMVAGFTLVHSTLDMPDKWGYVFDTLEAEAHFSYQTTALCFHGHTHVPLAFEKQGGVIRAAPSKIKLVLGRKYFINTGSVGQPRDGDPRSSYVVYNTKTKELEYRRVAYDIEAAQAKIRAAGLPERLAERLAYGR